MARLIYQAICSLDGCTEDAGGDFQWAAPGDEVHAFVNDLVRPVGTHLCGRRTYEVMRYWETALEQPDLPEVEADFARIWQGADKIVYSRTLDAPDTPRTRLEREFDPLAVRRLVEDASADVSVGGADLGGQALRAGVVDVVELFLVPVLVGGGKRALPAGVRLDLELTDSRRFADGTVFLRYRVAG